MEAKPAETTLADLSPRTRPLALCILAIPPAILLLFQLRYAITLPYMDQWELVPTLEAWRSGQFTLGDLFAQHNAHRIAIPRATMLALAKWSDWDIRLEVALNYILGIALFSAVLSGQEKRPNTLPLLPLAIASLLIFSIAQWRNWLWGWQMQIFMCCLFAAAALAIITRSTPTPASIAIAAALGFCATFSFAAGLALWPAAALTILRNGSRRWLAAWLLICATTFAAYLYGFAMPSDATPPDITLRTPLDLALYISAFIGSALAAFSPSFSVLVGASGIALLLGSCWNRIRANEPIGFNLALGLFIIGAACVAAAGRSGEGINQAVASRYTTFSALFWVGLVFHHTRDRLTARALASIAIVACLASATSAYGIYGGTQRANFYNAAREALIAGKDWEALKRLYPDEEKLKERRSYLEEEKLSVFAGD